MIYKRWISLDRPEESSRQFDTVNQAIESDRGRIIFSSPFRRLQNKAQVFPLEGNAAVRSRLTHSLEVAHIGRYLAQEVLSLFEQRDLLSVVGLEDRQQAFITLVENACLLHDIGNPPFGHFGESAIRNWFSKQGKVAFREAVGGRSVRYLSSDYQDFLKFDGNAQGFRIITRLQGEDGKTGLNLTFSQLASYLKYVSPPQKTSGSPRICKKPGYFNTETDVVDAMREKLGLKDSQRFPMASLMEAADDIAYCLSDVEDGIEKGLITIDTFIQALKNGAAKESPPLNLDTFIENKESARVSKFVGIRTGVFNTAVKHVAGRFVEYHDEICNGDPVELMEKNSDIDRFFSLVRENVAKDIYRSKDAEHVELAGHAVVHGLLESFCSLLSLAPAEFRRVLEDDVGYCKDSALELEMRLAHMLPQAAIRTYIHMSKDATPTMEWHCRAHLVLDYICGMTDHFALRTYQLLSGISIGAGLR